MTDYIASDWIENTGAVPDGVGPDTRVEVLWSDGESEVWHPRDRVPNNHPWVWEIDGCNLDVIRFRFLETPAERAVRLDHSETGSGHDE